MHSIELIISIFITCTVISFLWLMLIKSAFKDIYFIMVWWHQRRLALTEAFMLEFFYTMMSYKTVRVPVILVMWRQHCLWGLINDLDETKAADGMLISCFWMLVKFNICGVCAYRNVWSMWLSLEQTPCRKEREQSVLTACRQVHGHGCHWWVVCLLWSTDWGGSLMIAQLEHEEKACLRFFSISASSAFRPGFDSLERRQK